MKRGRIGWVVTLAIFGLAGARGHGAQQPKAGQSAPTKATPTQAAPASSAAAGMASPSDMPEIRDYWNPTVGTGEVYQITAADGKRTEEFDILSEETLGGTKGYWLAFHDEYPSISVKVSGKALVVPEEPQARKLILQLVGMGAMDIPVAAPMARAKPNEKSAPKLVGTESVSVPAGKFECERWKNQDGTEVWISDNVGPSKIVKMVGENGEEMRVLVKTTSKAKDPVSGPVKPYSAETLKKYMQRPKSQ